MYTPTQVAKICGVKPSTVYAWISRKEISAFKIGANRYISLRQIQDFYLNRGNPHYVDRRYEPDLVPHI
jgi:excisionase family DNA binding protein